jgi:eukaryotic-like serine/threonine-protein kinase
VSSSKPAAPQPTQIAGRYEVVQKLGAGAFGTVYKARDARLRGRMVAIKTIRLEGLAASTASLDDLLKRFKLEADIAANLKHPNIVTIYDIGEADGLTYLAMEFIDGVGLERVIAGSGKMSVERAASIGAQVADALDFAHRNGVVHRDIKPANIMIEPGDRVKVTDFGIAKATDSGEHLTLTGSLLGTPSYMSPEQARGATVDGRSDLFSLGCVLYEMLAGHKAFRGDSITALLFKIITEEPPSLRELDPTVSDEMLRIVARALSKAPENRYQTGRELADDLLAVTRPGFVPTLRSAGAPTLPPDASPRDVPTVVSPPTVRPDVTIGSAATAARPGATSSTQPAGAAPPPLPPTVLTPSTVQAPPAAAPPAARPPRPLAATPVRRQGAGAGLIVGLGLAAVLGLAVVVGGGYYLLGRKPAAIEPSPTAVAATEPEGAAETAVPGATAEAAPTPATAAPPAAPTRPAPAGAGETVATARPAPPPPVLPPSAPSSAAAPVPAPGGDEYTFLDEPPSDGPDGRAAGEALAQKYRSGGSTGYSTTRFSRRSQTPRGMTLPERPAVATLLHVHSAQEAFHRRNGRYGDLRELADAGLFFLDVPFDARGFRRASRRTPGGGPGAEYEFGLAVESDGYRMEATPRGPVGRALLVDDSGFVRLRDE